jgi:hypothetical protein
MDPIIYGRRKMQFSILLQVSVKLYGNVMNLNKITISLGLHLQEIQFSSIQNETIGEIFRLLQPHFPNAYLIAY